MSDPVTNVDIEDVLASIRRLVSGGSEQERAAPSRNEAAERLVLTPALRIDEGDAPQKDVFAAEPVVTNDDLHKSGDLPDDLPETETETESEAGTGFETEAGSAAEAEAETASDEAATTEAAASPDRTAQSADMWEPDGDDEDAFSDASEAPRLEWRDADPEFAPEAVSFDPDEMAADDLASESFARSWDAEDEAVAAPFELDEAVIDEEALRDLVAEIVRQELMGTLGERITRNVRKLVRREIHRALTSQDFD
ncbi:hypothetical protein [Roseovarius sp. MBR-6]|uniref:hypothetical protein n=1 Tax=Roseovarius sp. MBR-6 TaxID=3156459 RepID=UPI0033973DA5